MLNTFSRLFARRAAAGCAKLASHKSRFTNWFRQDDSINVSVSRTEFTAQYRLSIQLLAGALRSTLPPYLIDEFQITDPLQYGISNTFMATTTNAEAPLWIMIATPSSLFMVSWADNFYLMCKAKKQVSCPSNNSPSIPIGVQLLNLIAAVNTLFMNNQQGRKG